MAYFLPILLKPSEAKSENNTVELKDRVYHLELRNPEVDDAAYQFFVRQFIVEVNAGQDGSVELPLLHIPYRSIFICDKKGKNANILFESMKVTPVSQNGFFPKENVEYKDGNDINVKTLFYQIEFCERKILSNDNLLNVKEKEETNKVRNGGSIITLKSGQYNIVIPKKIEGTINKLQNLNGGDVKDILLNIKFTLTKDEKTYIDFIQICITHECRTWYGCFDYGSESSQFIWNSSLDAANENKGKVCFKDNLVKILQKDPNKAYFQVEKRSIENSINTETEIKELFKSFFKFDKEILTTAYSTFDKRLDLLIPTDYDLAGLDLIPNLKLLTVIDKIKNLKKSKKSDTNTTVEKIGKLFNVPDSNSFFAFLQKMYPSILSSLLIAAIDYMDSEKIKNYENVVQSNNAIKYYITKPTVNLIIRVLVPNMYAQKEISTMIDNLTYSLKSFMQAGVKNLAITKSNKEGLEAFFSKITAIEFNVLAEGDAVALGIMNKENVSIKNGDGTPERIPGTTIKDILVVDCGKGTTDISYIKRNDKQDYPYTAFRTGFAGAGNFLSYNLYKDFDSKFSFRTRFESKLQKFNKLFLDIENIIEIEKKENINKESLSELTTISNEDFDEVVNGKKKIKLANKENFVAAIDILVDKIINSIEFIKSEKTNTKKGCISRIRNLFSSEEKTIYIALTGRTFNLPELQQKLRAKLQECFSNSNITLREIAIEDTNRKTVCLEGGLEEGLKLNINCELNGILYFDKGKKIEERTNVPDNMDAFTKPVQELNTNTTKLDPILNGFYLQFADGEALIESEVQLKPSQGDIWITKHGYLFQANTKSAFLEIDYNRPFVTPEDKDLYLENHQRMIIESLFPHNINLDYKKI
jgi:hypothetical protein